MDIAQAIEKFSSVKFFVAMKRTDGPRGRDFYGKYCWEAMKRFEYETGRYECVWEGFDTMEECLADFILQAQTINLDP